MCDGCWSRFCSIADSTGSDEQQDQADDDEECEGEQDDDVPEDSTKHTGDEDVTKGQELNEADGVLEEHSEDGDQESEDETTEEVCLSQLDIWRYCYQLRLRVNLASYMSGARVNGRSWYVATSIEVSYQSKRITALGKREYRGQLLRCIRPLLSGYVTNSWERSLLIRFRACQILRNWLLWGEYLLDHRILSSIWPLRLIGSCGSTFIQIGMTYASLAYLWVWQLL